MTSTNSDFAIDAYCVTGNPVAHSRSPWIHARFAELTGQQLSYERALVALDGFPAFVQDFAASGGKGCNVTVPFKLQAAELAKNTALQAMHLMGGADYAVEFGMERQVREAMALTIGGGVAEIQRDIIAKTYGL